MSENKECLERLCEVYMKLNDGDKEKLIRLADNLYKSQIKIDIDKIKLTDKNEKTELKCIFSSY